jgi:hypothetical protein
MITLSTIIRRAGSTFRRLRTAKGAQISGLPSSNSPGGRRYITDYVLIVYVKIILTFVISNLSDVISTYISINH